MISPVGVLPAASCAPLAGLGLELHGSVSVALVYFSVSLVSESCSLRTNTPQLTLTKTNGQKLRIISRPNSDAE